MGIYLGDKLIANNYSLPSQEGQDGKFLSTDGTEASWQDASSVYEYVNSSTYTKKSLVVVDSLNRNVPQSSPISNAIWMYTTPVYPYIPLTNQISGTSYTFNNGGMVICNSPTTVTVNPNELSPLVFTNFVGILPLPMGTSVTTSSISYFSGY